jgi:hypothetical protein
MSLSINSKTFSADSYGTNAVIYAGPAHTLSVKDDLRLARTAAKPTSVFSGVGRVQSKLSRTLTLTGALTPSHEGIIDLSASVPVGAASADIDSLVNDYAAWVAHASFKTLLKQLLINY